MAAIYCRINGCNKVCHSRNSLCSMHQQRKYTGKPNWDQAEPRRRANGDGDSNGRVKLRIKGKCIYRARATWEKYKGPIPKGFEIHHKDLVRNHDIISNLECLSVLEHKSRHKQISGMSAAVSV